MLNMAQVLDIEALGRAVKRGVVVHNETMERLRSNPAGLGGLTWRTWRRPAKYHSEPNARSVPVALRRFSTLARLYCFS